MSHPSAFRRVLRRMHGDGLDIHEMSLRLGRRPVTIRRMLALDEFAATAGDGPHGSDDRLRPIERVVMDCRERGETYGVIGSRIGRSGRQARRIHAYARFKLGEGPLEPSR